MRQLLACCLIALFGAAVVGAVVHQGNSAVAHCMARTIAVGRSIGLYVQDTEERFPPSSYKPVYWTGCDNNATWPQLVFPYHGDWLNYRCPADPHANDVDLSVNPCTGKPTRTRAETEFAWGVRSDRGLNWQEFAPMIVLTNDSRAGSYPTVLSRVNDPANTVLTVDSVYDRASDGTPIGGGFFIVDTPAVRATDPNDWLMEFPPFTVSYYWLEGWDPGHPLAWTTYGAAWPWHRPNGHGSADEMVVMMADGHVQTLNVRQLTAGCNLYPYWQGRVFDAEAFLWDLMR